jgi:cytochrome c-type biogenesis protein CcmH
MDSQQVSCGPVPWDGVHEAATPQPGTWKTNAFAAGAVALLAVAVYAFPGEWSALWRGSGAVSEQVLDSGVHPGHDVSALYTDLERHLRWEPSDVRAWILKARLDMRAQRYEQAAAAYEKAVAGTSKAARDAGVWVEYAEARGMAQGRTLAGEPLKLVHKALAIDGNHPQALDLAGSAAWETRDFAQAALYWKQLLQQLPPGTAQHAELARAIERAEQRARISLPPGRSALSAN